MPNPPKEKPSRRNSASTKDPRSGMPGGSGGGTTVVGTGGGGRVVGGESPTMVISRLSVALHCPLGPGNGAPQKRLAVAKATPGRNVKSSEVAKTSTTCWVPVHGIPFSLPKAWATSKPTDWTTRMLTLASPPSGQVTTTRIGTATAAP